VLVVDDNATNRFLLTALLTNWHCHSTEATDGAHALALLRSAADAGEPYDLALLDMLMPGMDGLMLARQIKDDPTIAATPLILLTSLGRTALQNDPATARLFSSYLAKPIRQSQLQTQLAIALQRLPAPALADAIGRAEKNRQGESHKRILIAEDNGVNQKVALAMLKKLGYSAEAVANGLEAIAALRSIPYDMVLMDCQMPEMDGFEATEIIRQPGSDVLNPQVTVIAMTANAMQGDRERCMACGMNDYLSKPVRSEALAEMLERWLGNDSTG
jgi:CheY-like chemotaxis protein